MDEVAPTPVKRGPGRPPKAKPAEAEAAPSPSKFKMKAKPNWEEISPLDEQTPDKYKFPPSIEAKLPTDLSFQWVRNTIVGQEDPQWRGGFEKTGWTPVHQEDFDGLLDGVFMRKGDASEINVGGMVLMARPKELSDKAKLQQQREARQQVAIREQALLNGDVGVTLDGTHKSALSTNRINRQFDGGFQRLSVPEK